MSKKSSKQSADTFSSLAGFKPVYIRADLHRKFKKFCVLRDEAMGAEAERAISCYISEQEGK